MRSLTLSELQAHLQGSLQGDDQIFSGVSTDSRSLKAGELYVALRGDNFDGHDYIVSAQQSGAVGALVSSSAPGTFSQLCVTDTQRAFGLLGGYNRALYSGALVAITGSSGKTTVKNMVSAVLSQAGETLATESNFNNEIGVPKTLLRLVPETEFAVVEMGAARRGDIAWLCELGRPTIALLLNAMPAHLKGFGGSVDEVAAAKGEIFDGLGAGDCAVINADQPWAGQWRKRAGAARVLDFALDQSAAIVATGIVLRGIEGVSFTASTPEGEIAIRLALPGRHNVANALAAISVGLACGLTLPMIRDGLESLAPLAGRLFPYRNTDGCVVVDDCYNANPGSVCAAIDLLASCSGSRTLILGTMGELGEGSAQFHRDIGAYAAKAGLDGFWGVGEALEVAVQAFGAAGKFFADKAAAIDALSGAFGSADTVLIKGSRSAGMEAVLSKLSEKSSSRSQSC